MKKLLLFAFLLIAKSAWAADATVYLDGSLSADCTSGNYSIASHNCTGSAGNAWNTAAEAWAGISGSNNKIWVRGTSGSFNGTYVQHMDQSNGFVWKPGTSWASFNSMENYNGEVATFRPSSGNFVVLIQGIANKYIELKGLILDGDLVSFNVVKITRTAIGDPATFIRIQNCDIRDAIAAQCFLTSNQSDNLEIIGNSVHNCGKTLDSDGLYGYGMYIAGNNVLVEGNDIYDNGSSGIQVFYSSGAPLNNIIRRNRVHNNTTHSAAQGRGAGIAVSATGTGSGHRIENNLVYSNYLGIFISFSNSVTVSSNTVYGNTTVGIQNNSGSGNAFRNNIVASNGSQFYNAGSGAIFQTNLCSVAGTGCALPVSGTANPLFTNPAAGIFTIQTGSPAIGNGTDLSASFTTDFAGTTRTVPWDIGAYKFASGGSPSITLQTPNGGESWAQGSSQNIAYTFANLTNVDIELDTGNDGTYEIPVSIGGTATGSFSWTVPNNPTTTAKLRIKDSATATNAVSAAVFTITASPGGSLTKRISDNTTGPKVGDITGTQATFMLKSSPDTNFGTNGSINANKYSAADHRHSLLKFTGLSQIPTNATVSGAVLGLYVQSGEGAGSQTIDVRRVLRPWTEAGATWNKYDGTNSWTTAGALGAATDRQSATDCQISGVDLTLGFKTCNLLTALVQGWVDGSIANYGVHTERNGAGEDSTYREETSNDGTNGQRFYLEVTYTVPSGTITVTEPTAVSYLFPGQVVPIRWQSSGISGNLKVEILRYASPGVPALTPELIIPTHPYNQADANWTVTVPVCSSCIMRVTSLNDPSVTADSQPFRIGGTLAAFTAN